MFCFVCEFQKKEEEEKEEKLHYFVFSLGGNIDSWNAKLDKMLKKRMASGRSVGEDKATETTHFNKFYNRLAGKIVVHFLALRLKIHGEHAVRDKFSGS